MAVGVDERLRAKYFVPICRDFADSACIIVRRAVKGAKHRSTERDAKPTRGKDQMPRKTERPEALAITRRAEEIAEAAPWISWEGCCAIAELDAQHGPMVSAR